MASSDGNHTTATCCPQVTQTLHYFPNVQNGSQTPTVHNQPFSMTGSEQKAAAPIDISVWKEKHKYLPRKLTKGMRLDFRV